ncbi:MAG: hypothetical protein AAF603_08575 [Pseudomonadota bacterium]
MTPFKQTPSDTEKLLQKTMKALGDIDPKILPHRLREHLASQMLSEKEIDALVAEAIAQQRKSSL